MKTAVIYNNREVVLHLNQLLSGPSGGVLQAILASVVTNPTANDTFKISTTRTNRTTGAVTTFTEMWTFKSSRAAAFQVAQNVDAATTQTNLIAAIVADSTLWTAIATTGLGALFASGYATQFVIHRRAVPVTPEPDRVWGVQTAPTGIKVVAFSEVDYTAPSATESNIPATDPAAKRFGFGRSLTSPARVVDSEEHRATEQDNTYAWHPVGQGWRQAPEFDFTGSGLAKETGGHLEETADHAHSIDAKVPAIGPQTAAASTSVTAAKEPSAAIVYFAISGTSADSGTIAAAGVYELQCSVSCWYRINAATAGAAAVVETAPARLLMAGDKVRVAVGTNGAIVAITSGGTGVLGYVVAA